jgi:hypothetical protein
MASELVHELLRKGMDSGFGIGNEFALNYKKMENFDPKNLASIKTELFNFLNTIIHTKGTQVEKHLELHSLGLNRHLEDSKGNIKLVEVQTDLGITTSQVQY